MNNSISSDKPKRVRPYNRKQYARTKANRLASQKVYYEAHIEERRKYQREYDARRRERLKQERDNAKQADTASA